VTPLPERGEGGVVHERDPRHGLQRPVVEEDRQSPALVLLGGDEALGQAGALVLALPRLGASRRLQRFRVVRWLGSHVTCAREASAAAAFISLSWLVRAVGLLLLLGALGVGLSLPLALLFLCAAAASGALPVAPAGAATQAGAGAAVLVAAGLSTTQAIGFAVAAQVLVILAGAAVLLGALAWSGGRVLVGRALAA